MLSSDVYSYVIYGRVFAIYGGDPYSVLPHYQADPYEPLSYWKTDPSFYGPLWTLLSAKKEEATEEKTKVRKNAQKNGKRKEERDTEAQQGTR